MWFLLWLHKTQDQGDSGRHCLTWDQDGEITKKEPVLKQFWGRKLRIAEACYFGLSRRQKYNVAAMIH